MTTDAPQDVPVAAPVNRGRKTALDMARSVAVIGAAVAVVFLLIPRPETRVVQPVDVVTAATGLQPQASFQLVVPQLPDSWTPTSVRFRPDSADAVPTWHIGYLTALEGYAGVEVTDEVTPRWLDEQTAGASATQDDADADAGAEPEQVEVAGRTWRVLRSEEPERTHLVLEEDGLTTVVNGSADVEELTQLAQATVAART